MSVVGSRVRLIYVSLQKQGKIYSDTPTDSIALVWGPDD